jgi:hypothetical protein
MTGRYEMSTYRMMQKLSFVHYQKMCILKNIVVFDFGHLARYYYLTFILIALTHE